MTANLGELVGSFDADIVDVPWEKFTELTRAAAELGVRPLTALCAVVLKWVLRDCETGEQIEQRLATIKSAPSMLHAHVPRLDTRSL